MSLIRFISLMAVRFLRQSNQIEGHVASSRGRLRPTREGEPMGQILWIIFVIIVAVWLVGLLLDVAGGFIHLLLVIALIVLVYNLLTGRKNV
jgi:hypothetical protein